MKLIIGLGNPGTKYENNRHNVGFRVVNALATKLQRDQAIKWEANGKLDSSLITITSPYPLILAKPQTFMNSSGEAVAKLINWYKVEPDDLWVGHDDLDIPLGAYKIQKGRGPRLHYGVQSIEKALGTEDFWRVRIGIDNRRAPEGTDVSKPEARSWHTPGEQYVLQDFTEEEQEIVDEVINKIIAELKPITNNQ